MISSRKLCSVAMSEGKAESEKASAKSTQLPLARVKRSMQCVPDIGQLSSESVTLMTKATELFVVRLVEQTAKPLLARQKGSTLKYDNLAEYIHTAPELNFLDDIIPQRIQASDLPPWPEQ
eukprot:TRINITY_DN3579_c0_g1_i2.p1 TRINITY_DN3579_c0_g1~~TRINITY_DN3579_c0_g1_i2.p1  ORF type:complete len:121 (-),score=8.60 TRINITY_DN3579_c0_g1_i2:218-580(-)